jgi:hypothetical protein
MTGKCGSLRKFLEDIGMTNRIERNSSIGGEINYR